MAENLPEPKSRTESYLAKAAGEDVTIPEKPESRLEQYLAAIAEGGGGGGGTTYTAGDGITIENNTISADLAQTGGSSTTKIMSQKAVTDFISGAKSIKFITDLPFNYPENNPDGYIISDLFTWEDIYYADENSVKLYYSENDYINFSGYLQVSLCDYSFDDYEINTYGFTITKLNGTSNTPEIYVGQTQYIPEHWDETLEDDVPASWTSLSFEQVGAGGGGGAIKVLTADDYNYDSEDTGSFDTIALWLLDDGIYELPSSSSVSVTGAISGSNYSHFNSGIKYDQRYRIMIKNSYNFWFFKNTLSSSSYLRDFSPWFYCTIDPQGEIYTPTEKQLLTFDNIVNSLSSTNTASALSANQGRVLNEKIGDLSTLTTTDKTSAVAAINELAQGGGGGVKVLSTADYNYPTNNPTTVALWLLPAGQYIVPDHFVYWKDNGGGTSSSTETGILVLQKADATLAQRGLFIIGTGNRGTSKIIYGIDVNGDNSTELALSTYVINNLTNDSGTNALSAYQGKVLKGLIDALDARVTALESN